MIKSAAELALMARAGALLAGVFDALGRLRLEGRSTLEINDLVERMIVDDLHARPASKGQYGFPYVLNASIDWAGNCAVGTSASARTASSRTARDGSSSRGNSGLRRCSGGTLEKPEVA